MNFFHRKFKLFFSVLIIIFHFRNVTLAQNDLVNPYQTYTYDIMVNDIKAIYEKYPTFVKYTSIGKSEYGRDIFAIAIGNGNSKIFVNGSHHAREWLGTTLCMYQIEHYLKMAVNNESLENFNLKNILNNTTIWYIPMINPDGVTLQQFGLSAFPVSEHNNLVQMNDGSYNFKRWKSNAKGVDLNRQYNINWEHTPNNYSYPRWSNHKGFSPESSTETISLINFINTIKPELTVNYHTSGEILYWDSGRSSKYFQHDFNIAKIISQQTGYPLQYDPNEKYPIGFLPWFVNKYHMISYTPELGKFAGNMEVPVASFNEIWLKNKLTIPLLAQEGYQVYLDNGGQPKITIFIDGYEQVFDLSPQVINNRIFVPLRNLCESLGAEVFWLEKSQTISIKFKKNTIIDLGIGRNYAIINGIKASLDSPPQILNNQTIIPIRFIAEALNNKVEWNSNSQTINIFSK